MSDINTLRELNDRLEARLKEIGGDAFDRLNLLRRWVNLETKAAKHLRVIA